MNPTRTHARFSTFGVVPASESPTRMNTPMHHRFRPLVTTAVLAFTLALAGCAGSDNAEAPPEEPAASPSSRRIVRVETILVEPTTFVDVVEITGAIDTSDDATLSAQTAGTVRALAPLGESVVKGQTVARLDPSLARAAVEQARALVETAQAQFAFAEDTYRRQEPLYRDSIISALEFENIRTRKNQAEAQLNQAKAALAQAEEQLGYTRITAPFAGIVEAHLVEVGEQVMPGTPVARVVNTKKVKVAAGVPERYALDIRSGASVEVGFNAYGIPRRSARVSFVGSVINPSNRTFPIEILLDNADGSLKPEMIAEVYVTRKRLEDRLVVPQTAVLLDENGTSLFVVERTPDGPIARRRAVTLGPSYGRRTVISEGLNPGDEVIVVGQSKVTDGDVVEIVSSSPDLAAD